MKKNIKSLVMVVSLLVVVLLCPVAVKAATVNEKEESTTTEKTNVTDEATNSDEADGENSQDEDTIILEVVNQAVTETNQSDTSTVNKYSSKDDKIKHIVSESFKQCTVCKNEDEHQEHMVHDEKLREYLFYPDKYFEEKDKAKLQQVMDKVSNALAELDEDDSEEETEITSEEDTDVKSEEVTESTEEKTTDATSEDAEKEAAVVEESAESEVKESATIDSAAEETATKDATLTKEAPTTEETEEPATKGAFEEPIDDDNAEAVTDTEEELTPSDSELDELYRLVESEAGIESSRCKELVTAVVLNRVRSDRFPNSIHAVIYAPGAFAVTSNNMINKVKVTQDTIDAVNRVVNGEVEVDNDIYFFRNHHFFKWCKPVTSVNHTYFSTFFS